MRKHLRVVAQNPLRCSSGRVKHSRQLHASVAIWLFSVTLGLCAADFRLWAQPTVAGAPRLRNWDVIVSDWEGLMGAHRAYLDAFVWPFSIARAELPSIYVRSTAPFRLRIYRLGWYGGAGAELKYDSKANLRARNASSKCGAQSSNTTIAEGEGDFGLVECSWLSPVRPAVKNPLEPGFYLAIVTATVSRVTRDNVAMFVVRDDQSSAQLVIVNPTDAQAYADWSDTPDSDYATGFRPLNLYGLTQGDRTWPRATKVSFNRPMGLMSVYDFFKTDYPLIRFLERQQTPYSLATDYDLHITKDLLAQRRSAIISGHGEYWSYSTRTQLDEFVGRGGNVVAMAANSGYWQIRYESSPAGLPGPVVVAYKETALHTGPIGTDPDCSTVIVPALASSCGDPLFADANKSNDFLVTTQFRNQPVNRPEQILFGVQYQLAPGSNGFELPVTLFTDRIASMRSIGAGILPAGDQDIGVYWNDPDPTQPNWYGNIGWEADVIHPHVLLQMPPAACLVNFGATRWPWAAAPSAKTQAHLVLYRASPIGGYVFSGLSMLWSWGLDDWAAIRGFGGPRTSRVDSTLQTLSNNMLLSSENGDFGADCASPIRLSYYFAKTDLVPGSISLILKESDPPGRWSIVPVQQEVSRVLLKPDPVATAVLSEWAANSDAFNLFVADVNADGLADLVAKEKNSPGKWYVALGTGPSFDVQAVEWLSDWAVVSDSYNLFVADVSGDGRADLVAKEKNAPGNWYVALSTGSSFSTQSLPWAAGWAVASAPYDLFVADVNGDSKADLIAKEKSGPGNWYVALSTGLSFQEQPLPWLGGWAVASDAYDLRAADVNGDGKADLIAKEKSGPGNWYVAISMGGYFQAQAEPMLGH